MEKKTHPIKTWENDKPQTKYYWIQKRPNSRYTQGLTDQNQKTTQEKSKSVQQTHSNFNTKPKETKKQMHTCNKTMKVTFEQDYRPVCYGQKKTNCSFDSTCLFRLQRLIFKRQKLSYFKPDFLIFSINFQSFGKNKGSYIVFLIEEINFSYFSFSSHFPSFQPNTSHNGPTNSSKIHN